MPWVHQFGKIQIDKVDNAELVNEPWAENKGHSRQDYEQLMRDYVEIEKRTDAGWRPDDFHNLAQSSTPDEQRLGQSYHTHMDQLHGNGIKVDWIESKNSYDVTNGRHRLEVARDMGMHTLPGYIAAPDQQTMDRLQAESSQLNNRHLQTQDQQASITHGSPEQGYRPSWQKNNQYQQEAERVQSNESVRSVTSESQTTRPENESQEYSPSWESAANNSEPERKTRER